MTETCAETRAPGKANDRRTAGAAAMWGVATAVALMFAGGTVPTPLWEIYASAFGFSGMTLTLVYAAYMLGTLAALLFLGRLSDQIGRRGAAVPAIALAILSTIVFLAADGTAALYGARILSGLAIGIMAGAGTAWLAELHPRHDKDSASLIAAGANLAGLGAGPLIAGLLVQYGPWPLRLSYLALLLLLLLAGWLAWHAPETVQHRQGRLQLDLRPRIGVPRRLWGAFVAPGAAGFASFALSGFYAALLPTLLRRDLGVTNLALAGFIVFLMFGIGPPVLFFLRRLDSRAAMTAGLVLLPPSIALLLAAGAYRSVPVLIAAALLGGAASALGFRGGLQVVSQIAPPERRGEVVSSFLAACYLGIALPVVGIGIVSELAEPQLAIRLFAGLVVLLAALALATGRRVR